MMSTLGADSYVDWLEWLESTGRIVWPTTLGVTVSNLPESAPLACRQYERASATANWMAGIGMPYLTAIDVAQLSAYVQCETDTPPWEDA